MRSLPPFGSPQTNNLNTDYTHTYFKFISKIPNSERFCKNFVNKGIQSIYFHIKTKCVFIWYMLNLNYKGIHFILVKGVF